MSFDWTKLLPFVGNLALGNVPGAVATAASIVGDAIGKPVDPTHDAVSAALAGATPEQLAAIRASDNALKTRYRELDTEDRRIEASTTQAYLGDVVNARTANAGTHGVLVLGYLINAASYACIAMVLYGCFWLLGGGEMSVDPGIAAMIGGIVGAAVQWIMSNAAQANSFFYGSSPASRQVTSDVSKAVTDAFRGDKK